MIERNNYHLIKEYLEYLRKHKPIEPESVGRYWYDLRHFLLWCDSIHFKFCHKIGLSFNDYLDALRVTHKNKVEEPMDVETKKKTIEVVKKFLTYCKAYHEKEFRPLPLIWIQDMKPYKLVEDSAIHEYFTVDEILKIVRYQSDQLKIKEIQGSVALIFLSGIRSGAFCTLPISAVNIPSREIYQFPEKFGVETKNDVSSTTFIANNPEILACAGWWDSYLRTNVPRKQWNTHRWYSPLKSNWGDISISFETPGKNRKQSLGDDFQQINLLVENEQKSPHKARHGNAVMLLETCRTMAEYQDISRNLMHRSVTTTDSIYAIRENRDRKATIERLSSGREAGSMDQDLMAYLESIAPGNIPEAIQILAGRLTRK